MMRPQKRYIRAFDPCSAHPDPNRAMMPEVPPIAVEAIGANTICVTMGSVSRVLDGVALCDVVNKCLHDFRHPQYPDD